MPQRLTQQEFEHRVHAIHGDTYDISNTVYKNRRTKISVRCYKHGLFNINPQSFLKGHGCPQCGFDRHNKALSHPHFTFDECVKKMRDIHGDKYNYIKPEEYQGVCQKIKIVCKKCGNIFEQEIRQHLNGRGCPKCKAIKSSATHKSVAQKKLRKPVCGVGIYDSDVVEVYDPIYRIWREMICRCYGDAQKKRPSYQGCKVCDDWLVFSTYKEWYKKHHIEGFDVDKDLLSGKLYSPETCVFLPSEINSFLVVKIRKNKKPFGVYKIEYGYFAKCGSVYLGVFKSADDAKNAFINEKKRQLFALAEKWKDKIEDRAYKALLNLDIVKHFNL